MTRDIFVTVLIIYSLCHTTATGTTQTQSPNVTSTQVSLLTPSRVQFTCTAEDNSSIQSVTWCDPDGNLLNSTLVRRENTNVGSVVIATLEVERVTCSDALYSCVFETETTSFHAEINCPPVPEVQFEFSEYTVAESEGLLLVCMTVLNATSGTLLTITETDHTASRRQDFTLPQAFNLTITSEQLTPFTLISCVAHSLCGQLCVSISIAQDFVFEHELESFVLRVRARDVLAQSTSQTTVFIQDDDRLVVGFEMGRITVVEGDKVEGTQCTTSVKICAKVTGSILGLPVAMVPVWQAGTATEGIDYIPPPCNFTFPPGGFVDCMDLTIVNDDVLELTETLSVSVGCVFVDSREITLGGRVKTNVREAVIEITDNDVFELAFEESMYTIHEGGPGENHVALKACLQQSDNGAQSVQLEAESNNLTFDLTISSQDGTATCGDDYIQVNSTVSLTLPLLAKEVCECVQILHDQVVEGVEYFDLQLHSSNPRVNTDRSRVGIRDNSQSAVTVGFERSVFTVSEGEGSLEVCVSLSGHHQRSIHVFLCAESDTATENLDFIGFHLHPLRFPADPFSSPTADGRLCVNVSVLDDGVLETEERFSLLLQSSDPAVEFSLSTASVHILNAGGVLPSLRFVNNTPSVSGNVIHAEFTVSNTREISSLSCALMGPGRTPTMSFDCSSGQVTYSNLPLRRQRFTLTVTALLHSQPNKPMVLTQTDIRLDHDVCWLHPINDGVLINDSTVVLEWQATGPTSNSKVESFLCRRDREENRPCTPPYIWLSPSRGPHSLSVTPALTRGCRKHLTRVMDFFIE